MYLQFGLYAEPIFSEEGGFPKELVEIVAEKSAKEGYPWSRIPEFTDEERELVRGASDFFGVNHYTGFLVSANEQISDRPTIPILPDITVGNYIPPEWPQSASYWLTVSFTVRTI